MEGGLNKNIDMERYRQRHKQQAQHESNHLFSSTGSSSKKHYLACRLLVRVSASVYKPQPQNPKSSNTLGSGA